MRSMTTDEQIGRNMTLLRGEMSQKDLADAMRQRGWKWSQATVWAIEKGERPIRLTEAQHVAEIFGTSPWMLGQEDYIVQAERRGQRVSQSAADLRKSIQEYDESRYLLAGLLDVMEMQGEKVPSAYKKLISSTAHTIADEVHERAKKDPASRYARIQADLANGVGTIWERRLLESDYGPDETEG